MCDEFLGSSGNLDKTEITPPPSRRSRFAVNEWGTAQIAGGDTDEVAVSNAVLANFPSKIPKVPTCFLNQDEALNDDGYDSKGNLLYFADEEVDEIDEYNQLPIGVDAPTLPPPHPQWHQQLLWLSQR